MSSTDAYYARNAQQFIADTQDVDMQALHAPFLAELPASACDACAPMTEHASRTR